MPVSTVSHSHITVTTECSKGQGEMPVSTMLHSHITVTTEYSRGQGEMPVNTNMCKACYKAHHSGLVCGDFNAFFVGNFMR